MRFESREILTLALLLCAASARTGAGPPLITDDPETPGRNQWEINLSYGLSITEEPFEVQPTRGQGFAFDVANRVFEGLGLLDGLDPLEAQPRRVRRRVYEQEAPLIDINYGVTERDQIKVEAPVLYLVGPDRDHADGVGNLTLGYKYRFLDQESFSVSVSIYPQIELPTGARRLGLDRKPLYILPLQLGRHFIDDRLFVYGEVGFEAAPGKGTDDAWFYGIAVEFEVIDCFTVLGEINGSIPTHGEAASDVLFNIGFKWAIDENVSLMAAMGRSFRSSGPDHAEFMGFWGVQFTF